jgi:phosphatidylglycerol lysyltransferase
VMDFLFAEMFLWAKAQGYAQFDLNTAPMAGVEPSADAPLTTTLAKLAFEHGERFYNFKGVHRFKKKFHPEWEDVLLAAPRGVSPISALATAAWLTNRPRFPKGQFSGG